MSKPVSRTDTASDNQIRRCEIGQFVLGNDISKAYFDVYLVGGIESASRRFDNKDSGFKRLHEWLKKRKDKMMQACMEATSHLATAGVVGCFHPGACRR